MVKRPEVLALIPARGGSKGLLRKNIHDFAGYPLIAYSIAAGLQAETVTRVIVTTDDDEIAEVSRQYGAEIPFIRPVELAQDNTLDLPVFQHALTWLAEHENYHADVVVQLRPTSPVRPSHLVDEAVRLLLDHPEADSVRGVVSAGQNPHKMWRIDPETGYMNALLTVEGIAEPYNSPRQILPPVYWQTGHVDAIRPEVILKKNSMSGSPMMPLLIDGRYTVDIDDLNSLRRAEWVVLNTALDMVHPYQRRLLPEKVECLVFDFDGVMTDNRVWVDQDGREMVAAYRSDSLGLALLRKAGLKMVVISAETNPVVAERCKKIKIPYIQGIEDKPQVMKAYFEREAINPQNAVYLGNDLNDVPCFPLVGCAVVVADAQPIAKQKADLVLTRPGGHGAVRELCDRIMEKINL